MEAGNCPCIKLVKVLLKKLQNDLFKVLYVPWITAYPDGFDFEMGEKFDVNGMK